MSEMLARTYLGQISCLRHLVLTGFALAIGQEKNTSPRKKWKSHENHGQVTVSCILFEGIPVGQPPMLLGFRSPIVLLVAYNIQPVATCNICNSNDKHNTNHQN